MGFTDYIPGMGEDGEGGTDELETEFEANGTSGIEDGFEEEDEELEEEQLEWDTAYRFGEDMVQGSGFADMEEFILKVMQDEINKSPMYRDRIESGTRAIDSVTTSFSQLQNVSGDDSSGIDYSNMTEEVRSARQLSDELDKLGGKDEAYAQEALQLGNKLVAAIGQRAASNSGRSVQTDVEEEEGEW